MRPIAVPNPSEEVVLREAAMSLEEVEEPFLLNLSESTPAEARPHEISGRRTNDLQWNPPIVDHLSCIIEICFMSILKKLQN